MVSLTSLKLPVVTGWGYFIVIRSRAYLEPITTKGHAFGVLRHHQRRCTGRKAAPASLVLRGSAQLVAAIATALQIFTASDLAQVSVEDWQNLHCQLQQHRLHRIEQLRFRRSPKAYLASLEAQLLQLTLPL